MKKIIITIVIAFCFSTQTFASLNHKVKTDKKSIVDECLNFEIESYYGDCPDGSTYYAGSLIIVTNCDDAQVVAVGFDWGYTQEEGCN